MTKVAALIVLLFLPVQDSAEEAKEHVKKFKKMLKEGKTESDWLDAVDFLAEKKHEKILTDAGLKK